MINDARIIGYHVNSQAKCEQFLYHREMIMSEDTHWLGNGMYFWDNLSNAKYWEREKQRKESLTDIWIIEAKISLQYLLDLTEYEVLDKFNRLWSAYFKMKKSHGGYSLNESTPLGVKLNLLFSFYSDLDDSIEVIKAVGLYEKQRHKPFLSGSRVTNQIKILYCARKESVILEIEKYEETSS